MQNKFIGLIGVGYWGKNLLRNLHSLGVLEGCYDTSSEELKALSNKYSDISYFNNLEIKSNSRYIN